MRCPARGDDVTAGRSVRINLPLSLPLSSGDDDDDDDDQDEGDEGDEDLHRGGPNCTRVGLTPPFFLPTSLGCYNTCMYF